MTDPVSVAIVVMAGIVFAVALVCRAWVALPPRPAREVKVTITADTSRFDKATTEASSRLLTALKRVEARHQPVERDGPTPHRCSTCIAGYDPADGTLAYAAWPCATWEAAYANGVPTGVVS